MIVTPRCFSAEVLGEESVWWEVDGWEAGGVERREAVFLRSSGLFLDQLESKLQLLNVLCSCLVFSAFGLF